MNKDKYGVQYSNNPDGSVTVSIDRLKRYYPVPAFLPGTIEYQDVGKNMNLRNEITNYYLEKTINWMETDKNFRNVKKYLKHIKSKDGFQIIYNLLRLYVKNGRANWYDLRDPNNSHVIKEYLKYKLAEY